MQVFTTADGRALEYADVGDPTGRPVVYLHGTPATAGSARLLDEVAHLNGVRLLAVSRPGYGSSTTTPPGLLSVGVDIGDLTRGLEVETFAVLGTSGGGPFALATAAAVPERVQHVLVAAGQGPVHLLAPELLEADDHRALDLLTAGDTVAAVTLATAGATRQLDPLRELSGEEFAEAFALMAPPNEHYFDHRPDERAVFVADFRRAIERYDGYVRDNLSWLGPWDFDLHDVTAPVRLFYGGTDAMVPAANGEWLAGQLSDATLVVDPRAGHGDTTFGLADQVFATLGRS